MFNRILDRLRSLAVNDPGGEVNLPPLPRHPPRGVTVDPGETLTIEELRLELNARSETDRPPIKMMVPEWAGDYVAGATFSLRQRISEGTYDVDGNAVRFNPDANSVSTALRNLPDDVFTASYTLVERTLDLLAAQSFQIGSLEAPVREHCIWWRTDGKTVLRCVSTVRHSARMHAKPVIRRLDGTIRTPDPRPPQAWHPSFAYFRRSQLADDLDEGYRYLFLALEALLSEIFPWQAGLGEAAWLKGALRRAVEGYGLELEPYNERSSGNPYQEFIQEQYKARRCALFHSKLDKAPILPADIAASVDLGAATRRLGALYVHLAKLITGAAFSASGVTHHMFEKMARAAADGRMYVSSSAAFQRDALVLAPTKLKLRGGGRPTLHLLDAEWDAADLPAPVVRRVGSLVESNGGEFEGITMNADIRTRRLDTLQCRFQLEFLNDSNLREWFL